MLETCPTLFDQAFCLADRTCSLRISNCGIRLRGRIPEGLRGVANLRACTRARIDHGFETIELVRLLTGEAVEGVAVLLRGDTLPVLHEGFLRRTGE